MWWVELGTRERTLWAGVISKGQLCPPFLVLGKELQATEMPWPWLHGPGKSFPSLTSVFPAV